MELVSIAKNPVPGGAEVGAFSGYDGAPLRHARWAPTLASARGTVCVFPGRGEFIEKYFEVISDLRRRGYWVAIKDWRGQGGSTRLLSDPRKGHVFDFGEYDRDLARFMRDVVLPQCPPPYIALAHSMGANILMRNAAAPDSFFQRMVLVAPMVRLSESKVGYPHGVARFYAELLSLMGLGSLYVKGGSEIPEEARTFAGNPLTSDFVRWSRVKAVFDLAPHLFVGAPTVGWLKAAYRSCRSLLHPRFPESVKVPMLLVGAGNDAIVSTRAIEELGLRLKIGGQVVLPNALHEILQERDEIRQRFWSAFDAYLASDLKIARATDTEISSDRVDSDSIQTGFAVGHPQIV